MDSGIIDFDAVKYFFNPSPGRVLYGRGMPMFAMLALSAASHASLESYRI